MMAYIKRDEEADYSMPDGKENLLPKDAEVEVDTLLAWSVNYWIFVSIVLINIFFEVKGK